MILKSLILLIIILSANAFAADQKAPGTVHFVDLKQYAGKWYEIARYPNRFQKKCVSTVTATYKLRKDGKVEVINECKQANGKFKTTKGSARVVDKATNAKLKVTFFWPFSGDYWILDLDPDYNYAVVGEGKRKYLWVLSRTPEMDPETYTQILDRISTQGYDTAKLIRTKP